MADDGKPALPPYPEDDYTSMSLFILFDEFDVRADDIHGDRHAERQERIEQGEDLQVHRIKTRRPPTGHSMLLSHHLNKMKDAGELVFSKNNYMRPDPNSPPKRGRGRPPKPKEPLPAGYVPPPPRPRGALQAQGPSRRRRREGGGGAAQAAGPSAEEGRPRCCSGARRCKARPRPAAQGETRVAAVGA
ncbi:unnamed protein product [Spirodela intermedia]|uniref:Uncharacterized protein n=1 Tax=Spirodela intermedia TaxID=51605 RepID=A0A7I8J451_SPIIN|nr:unnamed protein product [Spirodela intermedia]CAA6664824.1 unnamed protein product [Spirodela intermedia]